MKPVLAHEKKEIPLHPKEPATFMEEVNDFMKKIEKRAFELFEGRGRKHGHDLDDWFKAESELFTEIPLEIKEEKDSLLIRAQVPGFKAEDLEISLEPSQLTIRGLREEKTEKKEKEGVASKILEKEIFRLVTLPVNVLPDKAEASLKHGVLEISAPKALEAKKIKLAAA